MLKGKSVELIRNLDPLIEKYSSDDKVRKIIVNEFDKRNIRGSLAISILNEKRDLATLDIDQNKDLILLFVFTNAMYVALTSIEDEERVPLSERESLSIAPESYFNEIEIADLKDYKEEKKESKKDQYVFHNILYVAPNHYKGLITAKELDEIYSANNIIYNFKNQRDPHIDIYGMKRIRLDKTKVEKIANRLLEGKQFSDEIKLNLLADGEDEIIYNEKTKDLTILSGNLNIFDGYHRLIANSTALQKNPQLNFNWGIVITNFSEKRTQEFMVQINEQKPMRSEHIKALDASKLGNIVVDAIRDTNDCEFGQNIKESDQELKFSGMTKKSILSISIEEVYKDKLTNRLDAKPVARHIANVMDHIIAIHIDEFIKHPDTTQKTSYINHKNMFAGYIALSERLYGIKNWQSILENALDKVDFSTKNSYWKDIGIDSNNMNKTTRNNLYKFFQQQLEI